MDDLLNETAQDNYITIVEDDDDEEEFMNQVAAAQRARHNNLHGRGRGQVVLQTDLSLDSLDPVLNAPPQTFEQITQQNEKFFGVWDGAALRRRRTQKNPLPAQFSTTYKI